MDLVSCFATRWAMRCHVAEALSPAVLESEAVPHEEAGPMRPRGSPLGGRH